MRAETQQTEVLTQTTNEAAVAVVNATEPGRSKVADESTAKAHAPEVAPTPKVEAVSPAVDAGSPDLEKKVESVVPEAKDVSSPGDSVNPGSEAKVENPPPEIGSSATETKIDGLAPEASPTSLASEATAASPSPETQIESPAPLVVSLASQVTDASPAKDAVGKNESQAPEVARLAPEAKVEKLAHEIVSPAPEAKVDRPTPQSTAASFAPETKIESPAAEVASPALDAKDAIPAEDAHSLTSKATVENPPPETASSTSDIKVESPAPKVASIASKAEVETPKTNVGNPSPKTPDDVTDDPLESSSIQAYSKRVPGLRKCELVRVGTATTNNKTVKLPRSGMSCTGEPQNRQMLSWTDAFSANVIDRQLQVTRTDNTTQGWGQFLLLKCCDPPKAELIVGMPQPAPAVEPTQAPVVEDSSLVEVYHVQEQVQAEVKGVFFQKAEEQELARKKYMSWCRWLFLLVPVAIILISFARVVFSVMANGLRRRSAAPKKIDVEPSDVDIEANMQSVAINQTSKVVKKPLISRSSSNNISKASQVVEESSSVALPASFSSAGWDDWEGHDEDWGEGWESSDLTLNFDDESASGFSVPEAGTPDTFSGMKGKAD